MSTKERIVAEAREFATNDFVGADEWRRSKLGWLTGFSAGRPKGNRMLTTEMILWIARNLLGVLRDAGVAATVIGVLLAMPLVFNGELYVAHFRGLTGMEGGDQLVMLALVGSRTIMLLNAIVVIALISVLIRVFLAAWRAARHGLRNRSSATGVRHGV